MNDIDCNRDEPNTNRDDNLAQILNGGPSGQKPDWAATINNLMTLAKEANKSFEFDRAINYFSTLEEIWNSKGLPEFSLELRIELHLEKGKAYSSQGLLDEAIDEYQKTLEFCRDPSQLKTRSETFAQIGQLLAKQGDHDRALGYLQRAIGSYRRLDDKIGICKALRNIGVVYVELGDFEEAEVTYHNAIDLANKTDDRILYADLVNNLGTIMNMKGNRNEAVRYYLESLEIYKSHDEIRKAAYIENNLAISFADQGMNQEAFDYFRRAYDVATTIKDASLTLIVDINLADLHLKKGALSEAKQHCRKAEQYLRDAKLKNGHLVETKKLAGKIAFQEEQYDSALKQFNEALETSAEIGTQFLEAEVLLERGKLYAAMEQHFDALNDLESSYRMYSDLQVEGKREQTEQVIDSIEHLYLDIFDTMGREVDLKDKYTKGHSDRVSSLALLLAREVGMRGSQLKTIVAAALLHDIGKTQIDDSILKKAGKLTDDEYRTIKKHPELGVQMLRDKDFPWDIRPLILHHHERIDGSGYPHNMMGEDIPLGARIICIADVFDALTSDRVYRTAYSTEKALAIMQEESGIAFDSVLLSRFVEMIRQGKADLIINSRTSSKEMFSIWSQCMDEVTDQPESSAATAPTT